MTRRPAFRRSAGSPSSACRRSTSRSAPSRSLSRPAASASSRTPPTDCRSSPSTPSTPSRRPIDGGQWRSDRTATSASGYAGRSEIDRARPGSAGRSPEARRTVAGVARSRRRMPSSESSGLDQRACSSSSAPRARRPSGVPQAGERSSVPVGARANVDAAVPYTEALRGLRRPGRPGEGVPSGAPVASSSSAVHRCARAGGRHRLMTVTNLTRRCRPRKGSVGSVGDPVPPSVRALAPSWLRAPII
jgi:hypothetical protein